MLIIIIIINKLLAYLGILYMNCDLILSRWSKSSTTVTFRLNWGKKTACGSNVKHLRYNPKQIGNEQGIVVCVQHTPNIQAWMSPDWLRVDPRGFFLQATGGEK